MVWKFVHSKEVTLCVLLLDRWGRRHFQASFYALAGTMGFMMVWRWACWERLFKMIGVKMNQVVGWIGWAFRCCMSSFAFDIRCCGVENCVVIKKKGALFRSIKICCNYSVGFLSAIIVLRLEGKLKKLKVRMSHRKAKREDEAMAMPHQSKISRILSASNWPCWSRTCHLFP